MNTVERLRLQLGEQPMETLLRWRDQLNHWQWPDDLPGKPPDFDELPNIRTNSQPLGTRNKYDEAWLIVGVLDELVPQKEQLRYHHLHNLNRTDEQFEQWWNEEWQVVNE